MRNMITLKTIGASAAAAMAMSLATAAPANAQSYGGGSDPLMGAILRGVLGAVGQGNEYGYGEGTYRGPDCQYYRDGRCYRNLGHWEREQGINSRTGAYGNGYGYGSSYDNGNGFQEGRTYSGRGYYRDGRFWRNHGQWRSHQNHRDRENRDRDYRYDRRW